MRSQLEREEDPYNPSENKNAGKTRGVVKTIDCYGATSSAGVIVCSPLRFRRLSIRLPYILVERYASVTHPSALHFGITFSSDVTPSYCIRRSKQIYRFAQSNPNALISYSFLASLGCGSVFSFGVMPWLL